MYVDLCIDLLLLTCIMRNCLLLSSKPGQGLSTGQGSYEQGGRGEIEVALGVG